MITYPESLLVSEDSMKVCLTLIANLAARMKDIQGENNES